MDPDLLWTVFMATAVLVSLLAGFRDPRFAFGALLFAVVNIPNRPPMYPVLFIGILSLPTLWCSARSHSAHGRVIRTCFMILWIVTISNGLALARGRDVASLTYTLGALAEGCFVSLAFVAVWNRVGFLRALQVVRVVGLISVALGLWQLAVGGFVLGIDYLFLDRFTFTGIADANYTALYLLLFISACLGIRHHRARPSGVVPSLLVFWLALVMTLSRTGVLVAVLVTGLVAVVPRSAAGGPRNGDSTEPDRARRRNPFLRTLTVAAPLLVVILGQTSASDIGHRVAEGAYQNNAKRLSGRVDTLQLRQEIWSEAITDVAPVNMALGQGDIDVIAWNEDRTGQAITLHSLPVTIFVKYGLFGLISALLASAYLTHHLLSLVRQPQRHGQGIFGLALIASYALFVLTISDEIGLHLILVATVAVTSRNERSLLGDSLPEDDPETRGRVTQHVKGLR